MKTLIGVLLISFNLHAACDYVLKPVPGNPYEVQKDNLIYQVDEVKTICFDLPVPKDPIAGKSPFVEVGTINRGNAQCGSLKLVVRRPNKPDILGKMSALKYPSVGAQPGGTLVYTPGRWKVRTKLQYGCNKYQVHATWHLK